MSSRWQPKSKPSYLVEMLSHRANLYSFLTSVAAGTFLSIPFGLGPALIPLVAYVAGASLAALFVPGSKAFQAWADRKKSAEARETAREHLLDELRRKVDLQHPQWDTYVRMLERCAVLERMAKTSESAITREEVEKLKDATIDFLGLWLGCIAISERRGALPYQEIQNRIAIVENELARVEQEEDRRRLLKARTDLEGLIRRHQEMQTRAAASEAAMMSIADTFDEVYQRVIANPNGRDEDLRVAIERMNTEEELDQVLHDEVEAMFSSTPHRTSKAPREE